MSWFLAGGVPPWAGVVGACMVVLVAILGYLAGWRRGEQAVEEDERGERAARQIRSWRPEHMRHVLDSPGGPMFHQFPPGIPPEVAHEAWRVHEETALALARQDYAARPGEQFSVTAWTQANGERLDAWLADLLAEHPAP